MLALQNLSFRALVQPLCIPCMLYPIDLAFSCRMDNQAIHEAAKSRNLEALRAELDSGVNVDLPGDSDFTALHFAARAGDLDAVKLLVERKATVDAVNVSGFSALHFACGVGHPDVAAFLLSSGASIDTGDSCGITALMRAALNNEASCVKLLLERKVDASLQAKTGPNKGKSALDIAKEKKFDDIVALLQPPAVQTTPNQPIHDFAAKGSLRGLQEELDKGVSINLVGEAGSTALHIAADKRRAEAVKFLVERKATIGAVDADGNTALHKACYSGDEAITALLLDNGAAINRRGDKGFSPLIAAVANEQLTCVKLLVARKADAAVTSTKGLTALGIAQQEKLVDIAALLQQDANSRVPATELVAPSAETKAPQSSSSANSKPAAALATVRGFRAC